MADAAHNLSGQAKKFNPSPSARCDNTSRQAGSVQPEGSENQSQKGENASEQQEQSQRGENAPELHEQEEQEEQQGQEGDYNPAEEEPAGSVDESGNLVDGKGNVIGRVTGDVANLTGMIVDTAGQVLDSEGQVVGAAEPPDSFTEGQSNVGDDVKSALRGNFGVTGEGNIVDGKEAVVGNLAEGEQQDLTDRSIKAIDQEGNLMTEGGSIVGKGDVASEAFKNKEEGHENGEEGQEEEPEEKVDTSILKGNKVNKGGFILDENDVVLGSIDTGDVKNLVGKTVDENGQIWNDSGKVIGTAKAFPEDERISPEDAPPFADFPDSTVDKDGKVVFEGKIIGQIVEGDVKKLFNKKVGLDGDITDNFGRLLGKAERWEEEEEPEPEPEHVDLTPLAGKKVNKAGYILDDKGVVIGSIDTGDVKHLVGKTVDGNGQIWSDAGKVIGTARVFPEEERISPEDAPFADFPDATVDKDGKVIFDEQIIGRIIEGDAKKLFNKKVGPDGEISDDFGRVLGKAERWEEEEEPEPEPEKIDLSPLAGKRVNKVGNIVDPNGIIYGRLVEGDPKKLAGRMCDKDGNVRSESGDVVGRAELVSEGEREGQLEGAFSGFEGLTVDKNGKVVDSKGAIVGRLIEGEAKKLYGRAVDEDGDVLDKNGNAVGKAERWEEEEKQKDVNPLAGLKVNREGEVRSDSGDVIGKLTDGSITNCAGKEIDEDGDIVNGKGETIGHATLLENIPPEPESEQEPTESEEDKQKREEAERDRKLAGQMATCIQQSIDKLQPIMRMITEVSNFDI